MRVRVCALVAIYVNGKESPTSSRTLPCISRDGNKASHCKGKVVHGVTAAMFAHFVFLTSVQASFTTLHSIYRHEGRVVYEFDTSVTCALLPSHGTMSASEGRGLGNDVSGAPVNLDAMVPDMARVRAARLTVLTECWVADCVRSGSPVPPSGPQHVAYDPMCLAGYQFTTTQLPQSIKVNCIAALQFLGASYTPVLTRETQFVVCTRLLPTSDGGLPDALSLASHRKSGSTFENGCCETTKEVTKLAAASSAGIPCVSPAWVQDCLRRGQRNFPGAVTLQSTHASTGVDELAASTATEPRASSVPVAEVAPLRPDLEQLVDTILWDGSQSQVPSAARAEVSTDRNSEDSNSQTTHCMIEAASRTVDAAQSVVRGQLLQIGDGFRTVAPAKRGCGGLPKGRPTTPESPTPVPPPRSVGLLKKRVRAE